MPTYTVKMSDGTTRTVTADTPPQIGHPISTPLPDTTSTIAPDNGTGTPVKYGSALDRLILSFGDAQGRDQYIKSHGLLEGSINKPGFDLGDITSKAGGLLPILGSAGAATIAAPVAAAAGIPTAGLGFLGVESAASGAGAVAGHGFRQGIGSLLGVQKNNTTNELTSDVTREGIMGLLAPGIGKAFEAVARPTLRAIEGKPVELIMKAINPSPTLQRAGIFDRQMAQQVAERGYRGTIGNMTRQANSVIAQEKPLVDKYIADNSDKVIGNTLDAFHNVFKIDARKQAAGASRSSLNNFYDRISEQMGKVFPGGNVTLGAADTMRKAMDEELAKSYKLAAEGSELPAETEAMKAVADSLRKMINSSLPAQQQAARESEHVARSLLTALEQRSTKKSVMDTLTRRLASGAGGLLGYSLTKSGEGAVAGGVTGAALSSAYQSTPVRTGLAALLQNSSTPIAQTLQSLPAPLKEQLVNLGSRGILKLLQPK